MATKASSAASGAAYEEQRRKRVLENLKHLEVSTLVPLPAPSKRVADQSTDPPFYCFPPFDPAFSPSPSISAGSLIDLLSSLTVAPGPSAQDLGISEMSKSLLQAARLQKQNKVLAARHVHRLPLARVRHGLVWRR